MVTPRELFNALACAVTPAFLLILLLAVLARRYGSFTSAGWRTGERGTPPSSQAALAILERRYAEGEIDTAEFEEKRSRLIRGDL